MVVKKVKEIHVSGIFLEHDKCSVREGGIGRAFNERVLAAQLEDPRGPNGTFKHLYVLKVGRKALTNTRRS